MTDLEWFPMYAARFLNSRRVRMMDAERVGVYALLLCEQWSGGPIPDDDIKLAFLSHTDATLARGVLEECFELTAEGWVNPEMQQIRAEQEEKHDFFVEAGRRGGQAKARNLATPPLPPLKGGSSHPLAIEEKRIEKKTPPISPPYKIQAAYETSFLVFWELYPKKIGRLDALEKYQTRRKQGVTDAQILEGLARYLAWATATDTKLKHPATFLGPKKWWSEPWHITEADTVKEPGTQDEQPQLDPKFQRPYLPDMQPRKSFKADGDPKGNIGEDIDTIIEGAS